MSSTLLQCLFFVVWFGYLGADVYRDRPKIKTNDGHLIIEPASDKNIYLQTNGPYSTIFVGGINLLNINVTSMGEQQSPNIDIDRYLNGPESILRRLERLENRQDVQHSDGMYNVTLLLRRVNRLTSRVANLQIVVNNMGSDQCQSRPCLNGGTCLNVVNGYHCLCPNNWEGKDCNEDVNECRIYQGTDLGCQNRANCKNTPGSYECECSQGWYGQHCTRRNKDCSGGNFEMCGHGTCISTSSGQGITCICEQGWTNNEAGAPCLTDVNECDSSQGPRCSVNPRVECINLPGSFRCGQCPPGFEGDGYICSDIDECLTNNGGCSISPLVSCHNTIGSRICGSCPTGYLGDGVTCTWRGSCSVNRGGCHPSAQCIDNPALGGQMAQCICPAGMEGDGIGLHGCYVSTGLSRDCDMNPCGIHGQCHLLRTGYTCICHRGFGGAHCDAARDYCSTRPCLNGGRCRSDMSLLRGFRCECSAQYSGDLCQVAVKTCGGYLQAEEGSIVYPLSNTTYDHNARCAWVINTENDKVINVTFTKFNIESHFECSNDFLQIHDGKSSASQLIGRFCGNEPPKGGNIISSHNNLYFWFRSDQTVAKDGFALHWTSINPVCGGEINANIHGQISTPGSPGTYPPNRDCYWHLFTKLGKRIQLHFFSMDIETHSNCSYDFVAIYDGEHTRDPLIGQYCNSTNPAPVTSAGSDMLVHFHSDGYGAGHGFQASFAPAEGTPGCGGLYTSYKGEILSPSYDGNYLSNVICEYKIKTSQDNKIRIEFKSFSLERSSRCKYDYLKVYDGPSENFPLVGKFCGNTYPKSYVSSTNELFIKFKSDHSGTAEGFRISYETICQKTIIGDSGIVKSPGYPFDYPGNRVCEFLIGTSPGKAIQLTFQDFDIEDSNYFNCIYDNLEIRDGANVNSTLLGKYCGGSEHTPPTKISTHNYMYLKFTSDLSNSGTGFYANFTTVNIECGGIYRNNRGIINHPSSNMEMYSNNQRCLWIILAPEGKDIKLTWNRFNLEKVGSCSSDYVLIDEVDENNEKNNRGKYCGNTLPPALTSFTNQLQITFVSDFSVGAEGFSVSYLFLDEQSHCGGFYTKSNGFIFSPGWPKRYPTNRDCVWTITAPAGQKIRLNITQFDLERPIHSSCDNGDYLDIRNGLSETSALIGKFCGSFQSKRIISHSNVLYLHFHSDIYLTGNGFKIKWDNAVTGCGGTLSSSSGSISSPNYPFNYNENAECFYLIVTSAGSKVQLTFKELELEITHNCRDDYVELFDGRDENSQSLGKYCYKSPDLKTIESTKNQVYIKFRSDFYIGGKGFLLDYNTICQNNLTGPYGVIESPGYPGLYPTNLDCLWTIIAPKGNKINITFTDFEVSMATRIRPQWVPRGYAIRNNFETTYYKTPTCAHDYIQMKDSTDLNFGEKFCGGTSPGRFSTKGNSIQIKFMTNPFFIHFRGFRLEWARFGCGGYIKKTFGYISLDSSLTSHGELECEWVIETTQGSSITIYVQNPYMETSKNCTSDAIEFYNGPNINTPLLTKICHKDASKMSSVMSTSNFMLVKFMKQSSLKDVHFSLSFTSHQSRCGGRIETISGLIHSENYPKNYDNNLDCIWTLVVPQNHRIELSFLEFDLYSTPSDDEDCNDNIKIYDGQFALNSNYSKRLCPNTNVTAFPIISKNNILGVQFTSNNYGTAKGFKANFSVICGATLTAKFDGIISNDKWHTSNILENCSWIIIAPSPDQKISLTVTYLSIPKYSDIITNRNCPSSFLRILEGDDLGAPLVDEYCGRKAPPMIVSKGRALTLIFGAYNGKAQGKFSVHYSPMMSTCGGTLTSEEGSIASPNYPQPYPGNASCEWILSTSPGNKVYITFEQFDLDWSENCNEDYLEVRENNGAGKLLGVYCGSSIPTNTTSASKMYLKFHSNNENSGKGFILHYGFLHGNEIRGFESGRIASPLYPNQYDGEAEYFWRIYIEEGKVIHLVISEAEIPTQGLVCYNSLTIYDGYDEEATVLEEFCGILDAFKEITTSSNIVYIKLKLVDSNTGSKFLIRWTNADVIDTSDDIKPNCGSNRTEVLLPGQKVTVQSPGYPELYSNKLNCEWIFKAELGRHINLHFSELKFEEVQGCYFDYISIFSSDSSTLWRPLKENICLWNQVKEDFNSSTFMKLIFKTDWSLVKKGFRAQVSSKCGGLMSNLSGTLEPRYEDFNFRIRTLQKCEWTVKVRPGRIIKLQFEHFNITNINNECSTNVVIRNGDSIEAPILKNTKFCGRSGEDRLHLETSSNVAFITYTVGNIANMRTFTNFRLRYEEKGIECGLTSTLDDDHNWEIFSSPNYPLTPLPFSECVWVFKGPPGEILRIDFIDRFDLAGGRDCPSEIVEIRDGSTDLSPLKDRYCGSEIPSTVKTSDNSVYIKYFTQLSEPKDGFKANVSIDVCGGTISKSRGEVTSPGYPRLRAIPYGSICEWRITGPRALTLLLDPQDIELPESSSFCATKITVEEKEPVNNNITILKTYCAEEQNNDDLSPIQTSSNEVIIKLHIGSPSDWSPAETKKGFRFKFNSSRLICGGDITTPEGYLTSPGYPRETTTRYCHWYLKVPNKGRRIKLELLDSKFEKQRISIFNDLYHQTSLNLDRNSAETTNIYKSSQNTMIVLVGLKPLATKHRFKAKFSSNEDALCGGDLTGIRGELLSPDIDSSYTCTWQYKPNVSTDTSYKSLHVKVRMNSSSISGYCGNTDPQLVVHSGTLQSASSFSKRLCRTDESSFTIPSDEIELTGIKRNYDSLFFNVQWKLNPCGGVINANENEVNVLDVPKNYNDTLNCIWIVKAPIGTRIKIKQDGNFQLDCENEYLNVRRSLEDITPLESYCKNKMQSSPLIIISYRLIIVQYHSNVKFNTSLRLTVQLETDNCGGVLSDYQRFLESPHFPHPYDPNVECSWEINTHVGNRISLQFYERFAIELKENCSKDAVILYDWKDNSWVQMKRLCGRELPAAFNSTFNRMKVVFLTDADIELDGFRAYWSPICGGQYYAKYQVQYLYSPGNAYAYLPNADCKYEIVGGDSRVIIKFLEFSLEGSYPSCQFDNLTIQAESNYDNLDQIYCGSETPKISNNYKKVSFTFQTDSNVEKKGFKLSYQLYNCGGHISQPSVIKSPSDSDGYTSNENCTWILKAPKDKIVVAKFQFINLEAHRDCFADYVAVFNSNWTNEDKRIALICGNVNTPTILRSTGSTMVVQFVSDESIEGNGFIANIYFSYSSSAGCGGEIDLTHLSPDDKHSFNSPLINGSSVYENFLDCHWIIKTQIDFSIKIKFKQFHISPCEGVNQTAIGFSKCDCDYVQIFDGINPNDLIIGTYCGHEFPYGQELTSSAQFMSVRLYTDGELTSAGFKAELSVQRPICGPTVYTVGNSSQTITSPDYTTGNVPRGVHCVYHFATRSEYSSLHLTIKNVDLRIGQPDPNQCNHDKLVIISVPKIKNSSIAQDFVTESDGDFFSSGTYTFYEDDLRLPDRYEFCGKKTNVDLYLSGSVSIHLITSPYTDSMRFKGFELEVSYTGFCGQNYTELQGRINSISSVFNEDTTIENIKDCYTLITVPEKYTISLYFLRVSYPGWVNEDLYLDVLDGDKINSPKLARIQSYYGVKALFSSGRHILLHNHFNKTRRHVGFDLNYVATDKGKGCGGKLQNLLGKVTSPLYPNTFQQRASCEWELETPQNTRLFLRFTTFDLGPSCGENYVKLVDRSGKTISTYCEESPADYTSTDNFVKIVFDTTMNNGGTGWEAEFIAVT